MIIHAFVNVRYGPCDPQHPSGRSSSIPSLCNSIIDPSSEAGSYAHPASLKHQSHRSYARTGPLRQPHGNPFPLCRCLEPFLGSVGVVTLRICVSKLLSLLLGLSLPLLEPSELAVEFRLLRLPVPMATGKPCTTPLAETWPGRCPGNMPSLAEKFRQIMKAFIAAPSCARSSVS